jgi:hypothetical protein
LIKFANEFGSSQDGDAFIIDEDDDIVGSDDENEQTKETRKDQGLVAKIEKMVIQNDTQDQ